MASSKRLRYDARSIPVARRLRKEATFPERLLWSRLRGRALGVAFRRQHPVGRYGVDFYCPEARLVVEIDGRSHDGRGMADEKRQAALEAFGLRVVRLANDDVVRDLEEAAWRIAAVLEGPEGGRRSVTTV